MVIMTAPNVVATPVRMPIWVTISDKTEATAENPEATEVAMPMNLPSMMSTGPAAAATSPILIAMSKNSGLASSNRPTTTFNCSASGRRKSSIKGCPTVIINVSMVPISASVDPAKVSIRASATS